MSAPARERPVRHPTLVEAVEQVAKSELGGAHVALPARVQSYDAASQTCSCQPVLLDAEGERLPVLQGVPVCFPQGGGFSITWPLQSGDYVLVVFSERSMERWMARGDFQAAVDPRRFDLSDGMAIAGLRPSRSPVAAAHATDLVISATETELPAEIRINAGGSIIVKSDQVFLGDIIDAEAMARADRVRDLLQTLKDAISGAAVSAGDGGATFKANILTALSAWPDLSSGADKVFGV